MCLLVEVARPRLATGQKHNSDCGYITNGPFNECFYHIINLKSVGQRRCGTLVPKVIPLHTHTHKHAKERLIWDIETEICEDKIRITYWYGLAAGGSAKIDKRASHQAHIHIYNARIRFCPTGKTSIVNSKSSVAVSSRRIFYKREHHSNGQTHTQTHTHTTQTTHFSISVAAPRFAWHGRVQDKMKMN